MLDFLLNEVEAELKASGFRRVHDQKHPQAFGSRELVWAGTKQVVRLVWDGKESWILVQTRPSDGIKWKDVVLERVGRDGIDEAGRVRVVAALRAFLEAPSDRGLTSA